MADKGGFRRLRLARSSRPPAAPTAPPEKVGLRRLSRALVFAAFLVLLALLYTGYKAFGQAVDDAQRDWWFVGSFMPRSDDHNMPPVLDILREFGESPREGIHTNGRIILAGALFTLRESAVGFAAGVVLGLLLAVVLLQSRQAEQGIMPYVITSQIVPLVAIAPIVVIWGRTNFDFLPWEWQDWMSVSIISAYLTFFPVTMNALRGMQSPSLDTVELMASFGASRMQLLRRLQFPASVPYLFPTLRIAAAASVVGAIDGEISAGVRGGLGRLILDFAGKYVTGPERLYASIIGAASIGLLAVGVVVLAERVTLKVKGQASW